MASDVQQAPAEGRREQILAAARAVLAERGYERTTVSQIASRAEVAQGTFYLYFPSKESLPGELALELSAAMAAATARAAREPSLAEALDALMAGVVARGREVADWLLVANRGVELAGDLGENSRLTAAWREALEAFLRRFQDSGEIDPALEVPTTARVLRDLLDRMVKAEVQFGDGDYAQATADLVRRALIPA